MGISRKPNKKLTLYFYIFLISIASVLAITIDELSDSSTFDFSAGNLNITFFNNSMIDSNSDGVNDTLIINLTLNVNIPGDYVFIVDIQDANVIASNQTNDTFILGTDYINITFDSKLFSQNKFNYSVSAYNSSSNMLVYRKDNLSTHIHESYDQGITISSISDQSISNNLLRINLNIEDADAQTVNVTVVMMHNDSFITATEEKTLIAGSQSISIDFDNETIKSTHYIGNFTVDQVVIGNKIIDTNVNTSVYDYEDFAKTSYIQGFNFSYVDTNANNLSEFLELNFSTNIKSSGTYKIEYGLYDFFDNFILNFSQTESFSAGINIIQTRINGTDIYASTINGPYLIKYVNLFKGDNLADTVFELFQTNLSYYTDFKRPPLPDLTITINTANFDNGITNISLNVSNQGTAPAFNILIDLFDNITYSNTPVIPLLNISQFQILNYSVDNSSFDTLYTAIVDFNDYIDESNESNNVDQKFSGANASPNINLISAIPSPQGFGENVTITAQIFDANGTEDIGTVSVSIAPPNGGEINFTMNFSSGDIWKYDFTDFINGTYDYTIYVNDSSGLTDSDTGTFEMYVDLYSNIKTFKNSYSDNELVNITESPAFLSFVDDFNRANNNTIGNDWTENVGNSWEISSNNLFANGLDGDQININKTGWGSDVYGYHIEFNVTNSNTNNLDFYGLFDATSEASFDSGGRILFYRHNNGDANIAVYYNNGSNYYTNSSLHYDDDQPDTWKLNITKSGDNVYANLSVDSTKLWSYIFDASLFPTMQATAGFLQWGTNDGKIRIDEFSMCVKNVSESNESKIRNDETTNTSIYLLMKVQFWNGSDWLDEAVIQNDNGPRRVQPGENNQLKLDSIWNPFAWDTDTNTYGSGMYRAYIAATDDNDVILKNKDGSEIVATYNFSLNTSVLPDLNRFIFQNSSGDNVAWFGDEGNIVLKGICTSGGSCSAPADSFVFKDSGGNEVAHVDPDGNLCIEDADCNDGDASCNPLNDAFIIQDGNNINQTYIDLTNGELCLTGALIENGNP